MKIKYLIWALIIIYSCKNESSILNYPETKKIPIIDNYFGISVTDNYRWLEDDKSEETSEWTKSQNKFTFDYLNKIPLRAVSGNSIIAETNFNSNHIINKKISVINTSRKNIHAGSTYHNGFENNGIDKSNLIKINEDQFIEEFLPKVVCTNANCEVVDKEGNIKGYITNKELQKSLSKS